MAEETKHKKAMRLKGSVLFTVLCVMMVMLILMLATIGLAGASSRRAYSEYNDAQVVSTAQSVIKSVLTSFDPNGGSNALLGEKIYKEVLKNSRSSDPTKPYKVYVNGGGDLGHGLGTVEKIEFSYAGKDDPDDKNGFYITGSGYMIMKATVTVRSGTETTTYTEYLSDMVFTAGSGGDGGLLSTGGVNLGSTGVTVIGPFGGGLNNSNATSGTVKLTNEGILTYTQTFNQSVSLNVKKLFFYDKNVPATAYTEDKISGSNYQGLFILGGLNFDSDGVSFISKVQTSTAKERPYIFVTDEINYGNCSVRIGTYANDTPNKSNVKNNMLGNKVNVYCGNFVCGNQLKDMSAVADIYCYDESKTSVLGGQRSSPLINWAAELATGSTDNLNSLKGSFYTKGNLKFKDTGISIEGDLFVGGDLDLTEVTTANETQIPKVTGKVVVLGDVKEATTPITDSNYTNLKNKIQKTGSFPTNMELYDILGVTFNDSNLNTTTASGSAQLAAIKTSAYSIPETLNLANKIVQNPMEMNSRFYVTDKSTGKKYLKGSKSGSGVTSSDVINGSSSPVTHKITSDCTLQGTFQNCTIEIEPGEDTTKPLWIELNNVTFDGSCNVIVEDRVKDPSTPGGYKKNPDGSFVKAAPVNFYITDGTNLTLGGVRIVTKYYEDNYFKGKVAIQNDLILNSNPAVEYIPGIYIYGNRDESSATKEQIYFKNNSMLTGYILAPRAEIHVTDAAIKTDNKLIYDGTEYNELKIGVIGSVIVGGIGSDASKEIANDFCVVYVNDGGGAKKAPLEAFAYEQIPGYGNY